MCCFVDPDFPDYLEVVACLGYQTLNESGLTDSPLEFHLHENQSPKIPEPPGTKCQGYPDPHSERGEIQKGLKAKSTNKHIALLQLCLLI